MLFTSGGVVMENWLILYKLTLIVYFIISSIENNIEPHMMLNIVGVLILYSIINICKAIIKNKLLVITLLLALVILCIFACVFINPLFILFLPINILEINKGKFNNHIVYLIFFSLLFIFYKSDILNEILLSCCTSFILYELISRSNIKINKLLELNDSLKEKNENLITKMQKNEEYESQIIYTSKLEERNKIAQEIHDKLGHTISANILQLEASKLIMSGDQEKAKVMIQNTIDSLRLGMESIRSTLKNIKPPIEQMGINKIKLLVSSFSKKSGIKATIFYEGNIDIITYVQWKVLYDNISEALTNASKYSMAKNLSVKIQVLNKLVKTEIKDDGKGCMNYSKGIGIMGMEERTQNINGKLIVDGSDGFSVIILFRIT